MSLLRESASRREDRVKEKEKPQPALTLPILNFETSHYLEGTSLFYGLLRKVTKGKYWKHLQTQPTEQTQWYKDRADKGKGYAIIGQRKIGF